MGADLFESYVGALVSVITLAVASFVADDGIGMERMMFPIAIAAIGVLASVIATFLVRGKESSRSAESVKYRRVQRNSHSSHHFRSVKLSVVWKFQSVLCCTVRSCCGYCHWKSNGNIYI